MRVLVTGAAGFIGAEVARCLLALGHHTIAVVRHSASSGRLAELDGALAVRAVELSDTQAVRSLLASETPDAILHLAWYAKPEDYLTSRENLTSLATTNAFIAQALEQGCRKIVMAGTCLEYADLPRARLETDPVAPASVYASCKHSAWLVADALSRRAGANLVWGRIFHLHGPGEAETRLIPWVARQLESGVPVDLTGGAQIRDHLHVSDVAAAFATLLTSPDARGVFNVCSGEPVSLRTVLEIVGRLQGRPDLLRFGALAYRANEIMTLWGDCARLRALGWAPRWSLTDGLKNSLAGRDHAARSVV